MKINIDFVYPVGSIYFSVNNVNPSTYFGGTWVSWGSGRVPVGVDAAQSEFGTVEKTGGEKTHQLTISEMASHKHGSYGDIFMNVEMWKEISGVQEGGAFSPAGIARHPLQDLIESIGGDQPHNNLQPYITCYMFKRTA